MNLLDLRLFEPFARTALHNGTRGMDIQKRAMDDLGTVFEMAEEGLSAREELPKLKTALEDLRASAERILSVRGHTPECIGINSTRAFACECDLAPLSVAANTAFNLLTELENKK